MSDKATPEIEDEYAIPIANKIKRSGIAVVGGFLATCLGLYLSFMAAQSYADKKSEREYKEYQRDQALDELLTDFGELIGRFNEVEEALVSVTQEFATLEDEVEANSIFRIKWPTGRYGEETGISELPIDATQNADISQLQSETAALSNYVWRHCQTHRDNSTTPGDREKWEDCVTELKF